MESAVVILMVIIVLRSCTDPFLQYVQRRNVSMGKRYVIRRSKCPANEELLAPRAFCKLVPYYSFYGYPIRDVVGNGRCITLSGLRFLIKSQRDESCIQGQAEAIVISSKEKFN